MEENKLNREKCIILLEEQYTDLEILLKTIPAEKRTDWELVLKMKKNITKIKNELIYK